MRQEEQEMVERVRREAFGEASGGHPMLMPICLNFGVSCSCTDTGRSASFKRLAVAFARQYARSRVIERRSCDQMFSKPSHHVPMFRLRSRRTSAFFTHACIHCRGKPPTFCGMDIHYSYRIVSEPVPSSSNLSAVEKLLNCRSC